jgi:hypothetical protein
MTLPRIEEQDSWNKTRKSYKMKWKRGRCQINIGHKWEVGASLI